MTRRRVAAAVTIVALVICWLLWPRPEPEQVQAERRRVAADARDAARPRLRQLVRPPSTPAPTPTPSATPTPVPTTWVRCALAKDVARTRPTGTVRLEHPTMDVFLTAVIQDGALVFEAPTDVTGVGTVQLLGFSEGTIRFDQKGCKVGPMIGKAFVSGEVVATEGIDDDRIMVSGCGSWTRVDVDGGFYLEIDAEPCTLFAIRQDGVFRLRSDPLDLDPQPLEDILVELVLPAWRAAGIGVHLARDDRSIVVDKITPGTVAEVAGLQKGDRIVGLDGEDVTGLGVWEFVDIALGPEGSEVEYLIQRDQGEPFPVLMERHLVD